MEDLELYFPEKQRTRKNSNLELLVEHEVQTSIPDKVDKTSHVSIMIDGWTENSKNVSSSICSLVRW